MMIALCTALSFCLDLILGDPAWMPHPVVLMGRLIAWAEKKLRAAFPATVRGERTAGLVLAVLLPTGTFLVTGAAVFILYRTAPILGMILNVVWGWQALAVRDMKKESMNVYNALENGSTDDARNAVARIVGRDTVRLDREGIVKAAVETVAENFSDGVTAPMFYMVIGGAPLALCYKSINTMDSMIGYKNDKYIHFGRAAARLDDAANFIPARLSALLLILASVFCRLDTSGAFLIWRRDRRNHASPNSAQTEAAMAGALGIRLGGPAWYFGTYYEKPYIGDDKRPPASGDIILANRMLYAGSTIGMVLLCTVRALL